MRRAMAEAEVGDEQLREDPTTNGLVERVSELLGTEDALFLPSATMANEIAFAVHGGPGDELIGHRLSHPFNHELGAPAVLARVVPRPIDGPRGMFAADTVEDAIRTPHSHHSRSRILLVENTTNLGGGAVWPTDEIRSVADLAHRHGLACHMDGARLLNAVVASGTSAADYASHFDSVTLCFSKGLGAPVGAALAGSRDFIAAAWRFKHMFGGAMRQSGILAAAARYALDHNVDRLAEDHARARRLAENIADLPGIALDPQTVETNIVVFEVNEPFASAAELVERMAAAGVGFYALGRRTGRLVTHLNLSDDDIEEAFRRFRAVLLRGNAA
jgi:threonine aldolase